jgi:hypothetical protein
MQENSDQHFQIVALRGWKNFRKEANVELHGSIQSRLVWCAVAIFGYSSLGPYNIGSDDVYTCLIQNRPLSTCTCLHLSNH